MDLSTKEIWTNLTVVLPGMVTYGSWRLVILATGYGGLDFAAVDGSTLLTLCVLVAIALLQQAVGITVEGLLALVAYLGRGLWPNMHRLFVERFAELARGLLVDDVKRTVAQFFLSLNVLVGQVFVLVFLRCAVPAGGPVWLALTLSWVVGICVAVVVFRGWCAVKSTRAVAQGA